MEGDDGGAGRDDVRWPAAVTSSAVVHAADVDADRGAGGAVARTLTAGPAGPRLVRRLVDVPPGSHFAGTAGPAGELWFMIVGDGRLDVEGHPGLPVTGDRALWIPPDARYQLRADSPADLQLDTVTLPVVMLPAVTPVVTLPAVTLPAVTLPAVTLPAVTLPAVTLPAGAAAPLASDLRDCEVETTGDRRFRVLFGPGRGCQVATQFVGEIPPGRAPDHSHPYDELVLVLAGHGVLHIGSSDHPLAAGSCAHLPPGQLHCLENTGSAILRVLGVFHPADSPAAKNGPT